MGGVGLEDGQKHGQEAGPPLGDRQEDGQTGGASLVDDQEVSDGNKSL